MDDALRTARNSVALFDGSLVVGNHDSITLLGSKSQAKLRDYSRSASKLFLRNNDEINAAIEDVVFQIDKLEDYVTKKQHPFLRKQNRQKTITREYGKIESYIEQICLFFHMQQAQLLKEITLLEKLSIVVRESSLALEDCIKVCQEFLGDRQLSDISSNSYHLQSMRCSDVEDTDAWYSRLERRLNDLCISHTVALQNMTQINILYDNNLFLLDGISSVISNTLPIWQNQMTMVLGIERMERRIEDQVQVSASSQKYLRNRIISKDASSLNREIDNSCMMTLDCKLKDALTEALSLQKQNLVIRKKIQETAQNIRKEEANE